MKGIAVFGASSNTLDEIYYAASGRMGELIAQNGYRLVFGGGDTGVMGAAARGTHREKGVVCGVIPQALNLPGIAYPQCDELIVTKDLRDRMEVMAQESDAFVVMPGGFGTFYEMFEVITLNQLHYVSKPVVILNVNNYYGQMLEQFETTYQTRCAREKCRALYSVADTPEQAMRLIEQWKPVDESGWMTDVPDGQVK